MGSLGLVVQVLLFFFCALCLKLSDFCSFNALGLTPFGFESHEAAIVFLLWNLGFMTSNSEFFRTWILGYGLFKIWIFGVLDSELVITLNLEFFDFETFRVLKLDA